MSTWAQWSDRMIGGQVAAYRHQFAVGRSTNSGRLVGCPRCGLVLEPRMRALAPRYCPRCLAGHRAAVALVTASPRDLVARKGDDAPR